MSAHLRYSLDNLGWHDFEGLCQSLLKNKLGLGIESWGGSGDWGRDAYFEGSLKYPANSDRPGRFVFQCKFIVNANAAGAKPQKALLSAVQKECSRIKHRSIKSRRKTGLLQHYTLLTNAPIGVDLRAAITKRLKEAHPRAHVHIHDGSDLCAWIDGAKDIAKAFPQLWGLRDLQDLLFAWANVDIVNRSKVLIASAKQLTSVFVPTKPYADALSRLAKHSFVVLEGPPEMGKTAIGRIIALSAIADNWEAIECRRPSDFLRTYNENASQIFIADDFFGRTEYDPQLVSDWQKELPYLIPRLDSKHWLVLTTRAHLLNIAKMTLDLGELGGKFPNEGEVVVDAGTLTPLEKARILYRHLKSAEFPSHVRNLLKNLAEDITYNEHFTPERIRRLTNERLPRLIKENTKKSIQHEIASAINEELVNPTHGMQVSFRSLNPSHKWLLIALVESDPKLSYSFFSDDDERILSEAYERLCPLPDRAPFDETLSALSQAFVVRNERSIRWIHPSCQDLTISELSRDARLRAQFLQNCDSNGISLAISIGGGGRGELSFPLIRTESDWTALVSRITNPSTYQIDMLRVTALGLNAVRSAKTPEEVPQIVHLESLLASKIWPTLIRQFNNQDTWTMELVQILAKSLKFMKIPGDTPDLNGLWRRSVDTALNDAHARYTAVWEKYSALEVLSELAGISSEELPNSIGDISPDIEKVSRVWQKIAKTEANSSYDESSWSYQEKVEAARGYEMLSISFDILSRMVGSQELKDLLSYSQDVFQERSSSVYPSEAPDDDGYFEAEDDKRAVGIKKLFKDL